MNQITKNIAVVAASITLFFSLLSLILFDSTPIARGLDLAFVLWSLLTLGNYLNMTTNIKHADKISASLLLLISVSSLILLESSPLRKSLDLALVLYVLSMLGGYININKNVSITNHPIC